MKNRKVDLFGLLKEVLNKWPILLAVFLIAGIAGGGKYYLAVKNTSISEPEDTKTAENDVNYNSQQKDLINEEISYLNQYIAASPAGKINPYKAGYATATIEIVGPNSNSLIIYPSESDSDNSSSKPNIQHTSETNDSNVNLFSEGIRGFLLSGIDWEELEAKYEINGSGLFYDMIDANISGNVISLDAWFKDAESAEDILNTIIVQMNTAFDKMAAENGNYNYSLKVNSIYGTTKPLDREKSQWLTTRMNDLNSLATTFEYSNGVSAASTPVTTITSFSKKDMIKNGLKYGIAGLAVVFILLAVWILFKGIVLSEKEADETAGLHSLGEIDKKKTYTIETVISAIKRAGISGKSALITCDSDQARDDIGKLITQNGGDSIDVINHILDTKENRDILKDYESAIILVSPGKSRYADLEDILGILKSKDIKVLGTVSVQH